MAESSIDQDVPLWSGDKIDTQALATYEINIADHMMRWERF